MNASRSSNSSASAALIGDDVVAEACVADACASAQMLSVDWLPMSPAFATIHSAIQIQRSRFTQLCQVYETFEGFDKTPEELLPESLEFMLMESDVIRRRLDALCRFALVICGIEKCSAAEAAQWLGISEGAVKSAYDASLDSLEAIYCETLIGPRADASTWN